MIDKVFRPAVRPLGAMALSVLAVMLFSAAGFHKAAAANLPEIEICSRQNCFQVQLAVSSEARKTGLMFRSSLSPGEGMLLAFDKEYAYPIWMKNMEFPIDILWLNSEKQVVDTAGNVPPCRSGEPCTAVTPSAAARYVLELSAGTLERTGISRGDVFHWTA